METKTIILTESGQPLNEPEDGFVLHGCLFKGDGEGGLLGSANTREVLVNGGVEPTAYTNYEFIKSLAISPEELRKIADMIGPNTRGA